VAEKMKNMETLEQDKKFYVVLSGYLKFPERFKQKFGISAGMTLDELFPNPVVGMEEEGDRIQITYEFNKKDLEDWMNNRKKV
jgi:hypothetical protein